MSKKNHKLIVSSKAILGITNDSKVTVWRSVRKLSAPSVTEQLEPIEGRPATSPHSPSSLATLTELRDAKVIDEEQPVWPASKIGAEEGVVESPLSLSLDILERHCFVIGSTGSGKTFRLCYPMFKRALRDQGRTVGFCDVKGDSYGAIKEIVDRERGADARIIQIDFSNPETTLSWNPLAKPLTTSQARRLALSVSERIQIGSSESAYWTNVRLEILTELFLAYSRIGGTLAEVATLLSMPTKEGEAKAKSLGCKQAADLLQEANSGGSNARTSLFDLRGAVGCFLDEDVAASTSQDEFDFSCLNDGVVLILHFPEGDSRLATIQSMFVNYLFHWVVECAKDHGGKLPTPITFFMDEFASLGKIEGIERTLNTFRSRGFSFVALTQSITQLAMVYKAAAGPVAAGFGSVIAVPPLSTEDVDFLVRKSGEMLVEEYSDRGGIFVGRTTTSRPILTREEVTCTTFGNDSRLAVTFLLSGMSPFLATVPAIYEFPEFSHWNRRNGGNVPLTKPAVRDQMLCTPIDRNSGLAGKPIPAESEEPKSIEEARVLIGYENASVDARLLWFRFEHEHRSNLGLVFKMAAEISKRNGSLEEFCDAHRKSGIGNLQGILDFMTYAQFAKKEGKAIIEVTFEDDEDDFLDVLDDDD